MRFPDSDFRQKSQPDFSRQSLPNLHQICLSVCPPSTFTFQTGCSSAWLERYVRDVEAASSNLVTPIFWAFGAQKIESREESRRTVELLGRERLSNLPTFKSQSSALFSTRSTALLFSSPPIGVQLLCLPISSTLIVLMDWRITMCGSIVQYARPLHWGEVYSPRDTLFGA